MVYESIGPIVANNTSRPKQNVQSFTDDVLNALSILDFKSVLLICILQFQYVIIGSDSDLAQTVITAVPEPMLT